MAVTQATNLADFSSGINTNGNVINVGTALTLSHSDGIQFHTQHLHASGFDINNINASGIVTATSISVTNITASGNVSVAGTLTYEDVTNVDSVGLITARSGLSITGGDLTLPDSIIHAGDTNTKIRFPAADTITAETGGAERLRITSAGNLGIGENSPDVRLHVKEQFDTAYSLADVADEANHLLKLENPSSTANAFAGMQFRVGGGADLFFGAIQQSVNHGDFFFANQNSPQKEMMRIKSTGLVGIGTDNPVRKLDVDGTSRFTDYIYGNSITNKIYVNDDLALSATKKLYFDTGSNTYIHEPTGDQLAVVTGGTEKLRITSNGSVGIGNTASSNIKLDVEGSLRAKAAAYAAPTNGTGLEIYYATGTLNDAPSGYLLSYDRDASAYKKINYDASDHKFRTSGTERLRITSDGQLVVSQTQSESIGGGANAIQSGNGISVLRRTNDVSGPYINLAKSRNTSEGQFTIVQDEDIVGSIGFCGDDGVDLNSPLAYINGVVDGTPSANSIPGALSFRTVASGTVSTERLRINSDGDLQRPKSLSQEVSTSVSSTSATSCGSFAKATYRSAYIIAQITQGSSYQVGRYLVIHDGTTVTTVEESAIATGDMLGTFSGVVSGSNVEFRVTMSSGSSATVITKIESIVV